MMKMIHLGGASVVFFDTQDELKGKMPRADMSDDVARVLGAGYIRYVPSSDDDTARQELAVLVDHAFARRGDVVFVCDEAQEYAPQGGAPGPLEQVARRGRSKGVWLWAVSQHPADLSKKVMRQLGKVFLFEMPWSSPYFATYKIPQDELKERLAAGGAYSYCVWDGLDLSGPFKGLARVDTGMVQ